MDKLFCNRNLRVLNWQEARKFVKQVNPELTHIIDEIDPGNDYELIEATYLYGDIIVKNGITQIPSKDGSRLLPITKSDFSSALIDKINYQTIPLFLTLENDNEVFLDISKRVVPLNLFHQGSLLGTFETADFIFNYKAFPKWNVSAGARTIFMLPKISDLRSLKRLRTHFDMLSTIRGDYHEDHWGIFSHIAKHPTFTQPWQNRVLFFTRKWFIDHEKSLEWLKFRSYLFGQAWRQAQFAISNMERSLIWEGSAEAIALRNLRPSSYIVDNVKHILFIATDKLPGFRPADNNHNAAPIEGIQKAFIDVYELQQYFPTIMHVFPLNTLSLGKSVYYSLSFPTLLEGTIIKRGTSTIMSDIKEIKTIFDALAKRQIDFPEQTEQDYYTKTIHSLNINYFHVEQDISKEISSSKELPKKDSDFLEGNKSNGNLKFCSSSLFWRGCLQLSHMLYTGVQG